MRAGEAAGERDDQECLAVVRTAGAELSGVVRINDAAEQSVGERVGLPAQAPI